MDFNLISDISKHYFESTPENINGVAYGYMYKNGEMTQELGLVFSVYKKLPVELVPEGELIPKEVSLSGYSFQTDVIEQRYTPLQSRPGCPDDFYLWEDPMYQVPNRLEVRPLKGGVGTTNLTTLSDYIGTLGFLAIDNDTNSLVGISNNHVWVENGFIDSDRDLSDPPTNVLNNVVAQPHPSDDGNIINPFGVVKKYVPLQLNGYNYADVAASTVNQEDVDLSISYQQLGLTGWTSPMQFATSAEIDNLLVNQNNLYSAGRTTGAKGEGEMKLLCSAINQYTVVGPYRNGSTTESLDFARSIVFVASATTKSPPGTCPYPIAPGDSGSVLLADIGGVRKIVGICYASSTSVGLANRIDDVAERLNIRAWTGETSINFSDTGATETLYLSTNSDEPFIEYDSKIFWQAGVASEGPESTPTPTPTVTPTFTSTPVTINCGNGVTTGTYYYYDCCGQVKTGYAAGLLVVMDYNKPSNGINKLNVVASQTCPTPTPTGTPNPTPSNTPTSTVTPTLTQTPTVTPSSTPYPPPTPVYTAVNECQVFTVFDMGISCYTVTNPSSTSSFDGILKIEVTGGTAPFTFYWSGGQRSQTLYGVPAGSYPVTVVDYYGDYTASTVCQLVPISPTPSVTPTLTPTPSATPSYDSLCFVAYPTGRLAVVGGGTTYGPWQFVSNGTNNGRPVWTYGTYNIAWNATKTRWEIVGNDLTTLVQFASGVAVSTSTSIVPLTLWSFNGGATVPPTIFVTQGTCPSNLPLSSTVSVRNTNCSGTQNCSGSITFTANLGVQPYQYSINNGSTYQTSSVFNGLCAGVYQTIVRDASGTTNNRQVTVGSNNASVSYIVSIVSLGSLNNNVSQNESNQLSQFAVQVNPPIPSGTTLTFNLDISYQIYNMGPWTGNDPDATAEFNIVPTLNQNGSSVALVTGATTTSTTNRPGCNPSQMEITSGSFTKQITMTGGSGSVTGTTYVELNVFGPTELNGCVSTMESTITIGVSSAEVSGCYCCSVISNAQPIIYTLTEVGGS